MYAPECWSDKELPRQFSARPWSLYLQSFPNLDQKLNVTNTLDWRLDRLKPNHHPIQKEQSTLSVTSFTYSLEFLFDLQQIGNLPMHQFSLFC